MKISLAAAGTSRGVVTIATVIAILALPFESARAGGPPLVTDDPDTPGAGNWEVNFAFVSAHTTEGRELTAPDLDINYGLGDRVQLKADLSWLVVDDSGQDTESGLNISDFGVKWRFVDQERSGFALSIYPQLAVNLTASSSRRGLTDPGMELFLPLEASTEIGAFEVGAEVGLNLIEDGQDEWLGGLVAARACGRKARCMAEVHGVSADDFQTLVNFGIHWQLSDAFILMAAAGRDYGPSSEDQQTLSCYLGLQVLR